MSTLLLNFVTCKYYLPKNARKNVFKSPKEISILSNPILKLTMSHYHQDNP